MNFARRAAGHETTSTPIAKRFDLLNLKYSINPSSSPFTVTTALTWNANASLQQMVYTDGNDSTKNQTCNYQADDLSRIASVNCGASTWGQTFSYDPFGNIKKAGSNGGTSYSAGYSNATNQVNGGITPAPTYDANGNQKTATPASLTWNALNQPISVNSTSATYDALGRMVEKGLGGVYSQFVYNPDGTSLAVYSGGLTKGTISLPGGSTAVYNASGLNYIRHKDWLGSSRLATTWAHAVYSKEAYAPFGETYNEAGTADRSFTGQDQNVVTGSLGNGVYDYLFRKYDPSAGRWLSPDPLGWGAVSPADPQSLNRYSYVENQPLEAVDPDGYSCITAQFNNNGTLVSVTLDDGDGKGCAAAGVLPNGTITNPWTATVNGNDADGLDPEGCDPNSNAACMPTLGGVPTYGFSGPARNGPTYSQSQVCGASAMLHGGVSFFLDAIGVIPGEGNLLSGVQLGAGILSGSITAADPESKLPDGILAGGGIALSLADMTKTASFGEVPEVLTNIVSRASFGLIPKELSVIPVIGNFASAYSAVKDWNSMWKAYHDCMGGS